MNIPRLVLGGTNSRAGKTVISIGLMKALRERGLVVQPYKVGPDFIDPSYHDFVTGRRSRNLDGFMMKDEDVLECFARNAAGADIAVVEGAMGLFDSHDAIDERGSTAHVAKVIGSPLVVIANVERISRSAAALVTGYKVFDAELDVCGVILNRLGTERHIQKARTAVEQLAGMRVFGALSRDPRVEIPERHLGLVPAYEREKIQELFDYLGSFVEEHIDVDGLIEAASEAGELGEIEVNPLFRGRGEGDEVSIGVVRDRVFTFYYQDNIEALERQGARIVYIDSMSDKKLPEVDALYIGGGFPEVFAGELEENRGLREDIRVFCEEGGPVYAECGGLMYLGKSIVMDGDGYEMVGFLPIKTHMRNRFQALGYTVAEVMEDNLVSKRGDELVGHEFHHSEIEVLGELKYAYKVLRGRGIEGGRDGIVKGGTLATYSHLHVLSYPPMVEHLLDNAKRFNKRKSNV
ncbi:MAG: cobyrinate a,c-diamide synthase [Candidatus Hydrothermarchaeaceae archaeon]